MDTSFSAVVDISGTPRSWLRKEGTSMPWHLSPRQPIWASSFWPIMASPCSPSPQFQGRNGPANSASPHLTPICSNQLLLILQLMFKCQLPSLTPNLFGPEPLGFAAAVKI